MKQVATLLVLLVAVFAHSLARAGAPSVALVAPSGSVGFVAPASPLLYATATADQSIPGTTIVRVEFLDGASIVGTVTAPNTVPTGFAFLWAGASVGAHQISARATDSLGNSATSASLPIYVVAGDLPPHVTLTTPTTGQLFGPTSVVPLMAVAGSTQGAIQRVEFVAGNTIIATAFAAPFVGTWTNPPSGNWAIVARAFDDLGVATASPAAYIQVLAASRPPAVVITAPAPGSTTIAGTPLGLAATALAPDGSVGRVDFYAGSVLVGTAAAPPYTALWLASTAGTQSLTAKAIDMQGNSATSTPVVVTVGSGQPPVVSLVAPSSGTTFSAPATISLSATANVAGGTIAKVEFLANGIVIGSRATAPFDFSWTGVPAGTYSLSARATSNLGQSQTSPPVSVTVFANLSPTITVTAPTGGQTFALGQPVVLTASAADADGTIAKVEFLVDGAVSASSTAAPYSVTWLPTSAGSHSITARATDNAGAVALSAAVAIVVTNNAPPTIALAAPPDGQVFAVGTTITLTASASDTDGAVAKVEFLANGVLIGTANAAPYSFAWAGAAVGDYTIVARATDNAGMATTSPSRLIRVVPLTLSITEPAANATVASDFVLIAGTFKAPPNSGITVNGLVARNDDNGHFFINNFPLTDGTNAIAVTLTTIDGQTTTQTLTLTRNGTAPMQVYVDTDSNFAPSAFTIRLNNRTANTIADVALLDLAGSQADLSGANQQTIGTLRYAAPGLFRPGFRITDSAGNIYTQYLELLTQDTAAVEAKFAASWQNFANALISGATAAATKTMVGSTQAKYGAVFDALGSKLPDIVNSFVPTGLSSVSDGIAEMVIRRVISGKVNIFLVYFIQDSDGVWRLDSM